MTSTGEAIEPVYVVPQPRQALCSLLSPCHAAGVLRALIDARDNFVLLCGICGAPFLLMPAWSVLEDPTPWMHTEDEEAGVVREVVASCSR